MATGMAAERFRRRKVDPQLPQLVRLSGAPRDAVPMIIAAPRASHVAPQPPPICWAHGLFGN